MIREHDVVVLTVPLPEHHLEAGDVGTVVHVYGDNEAFEVEFTTLNGETVDVVTIDAAHVRPADEREITHARQLTR